MSAARPNWLRAMRKSSEPHSRPAPTSSAWLAIAVAAVTRGVPMPGRYRAHAR